MPGVGTVRYSCPIWGCRWYFDEDSGMGHFDSPGYDNSNPGVIQVIDPARLAMKTERELQAHVDTHSKIDMLTTISKLRDKLARLEGGVVKL